ncbi:unnamed protein product [Anisakis simplex]|uniref:Dehydrogenase/reductase SDR family member 13 (inferred by orthology to a human protein) n=1 Tax=Anisakis simplex TaxID=6269 RepID=A0A0M3J1M0_ANISI|nr:unnamed protein product [Anisakis simplex]
MVRKAFSSVYGCIKKYIKGTQFNELVDAHGKIAIVTGASSGIGKQIAKLLNLRGAKVYLLCRNPQKALETIENLAEVKLIIQNDDSLFVLTLAENRVAVSVLDLFLQMLIWHRLRASGNSSNHFSKVNDHFSMLNAANYLFSDETHLDILVNNAGVMALPVFQRTSDGFETTWQCNYLGHFLLTDLLIGSLRASGHGRIVNVSSFMHHRADSVDEQIVNNPQHYQRILTYNRSKLANVCRIFFHLFSNKISYCSFVKSNCNH